MSETQKELELVLKGLNKKYGDRAIGLFGDNEALKISRFSTGSLGLDSATGGGFPKGRIIEIYGAESSGKTSLTLATIAEAQKGGDKCFFVDYEHAFDPEYAKKVGVDVDALIIAQPDCAEDGLEMINTMVDTGLIGLVVIDSVAAMTPKAELEGEMGDQQMGLQARLMSKAMRKLTATLSKHDCCCIFINQTREKIGVMFGNPETTSGGNALKFYSSIRVAVSKSKGDDQDAVGDNTNIKVTARVIKNKTASPMKKAIYYINFGEGIDYIREVIDMAVLKGVVIRKGSWFYYGETSLGQGALNAKALLGDNQELVDQILKDIEDVDMQ